MTPDWLLKQNVQKLIVVLSSLATHQVLERWQFDIECDKSFTLEQGCVVVDIISMDDDGDDFDDAGPHTSLRRRSTLRSSSSFGKSQPA
jgi:hypothetical protein